MESQGTSEETMSRQSGGENSMMSSTSRSSGTRTMSSGLHQSNTGTSFSSPCPISQSKREKDVQQAGLGHSRSQEES